MRTLKHLLLFVAVHMALMLHATARPSATPDNAFDATPVRGTIAPGTNARLLRTEAGLSVEYRVAGKGPTTVTLCDASGNVVLQEQVADLQTHLRVLPITGQQGTYTIRFEQEGITLLKKLVIEQA